MSYDDDQPWTWTRGPAGGWRIWDRATNADLGYVVVESAPTRAERAEWGARRARGGWLAVPEFGPYGGAPLPGDYRVRLEAVEALYAAWTHFLQTASVDLLIAAAPPDDEL